VNSVKVSVLKLVMF